MTTEQIYERATKRLNEDIYKLSVLSMSEGAAIDGMLEQAKREGAIEAIEELRRVFRMHGVTFMLRRMDELEKEIRGVVE